MSLILPYAGKVNRQGRFLWANGAQLWVEEQGSGPPIVLLHGIVASSVSWRHVAPVLAPSHRVVSIDALANGRSARMPDADHSIKGHARRTLSILDQLGIERAILVGTSYGGAVAMRVAGEQTERIEKLVLVAPANPFAEQSIALAQWYVTLLGTMVARCYPFVPRRVFQEAMARMFVDRRKCTAELAWLYFEPLKTPGTVRCLLKSLESFAGDLRMVCDDLEILKRVPMSLIWGDRDPVIEPHSLEWLARELLSADATVMQGVGHLPYEEAPQEFARILLDACRVRL